MPTSKKRLTAAEAKMAQRSLTQLRSEGFDFGPDADVSIAEEERCPLEITEGRGIGMATDLGSDMAAYALPLRLVARSPVTIEECCVAAPWDEVTGSLPYLKETGGRYRLGSLSYPVGEVLNDHFDQPYSMQTGATLEGVLLAEGLEPIPDHVVGGVVSLRVTFVDTFQREATKTMSVPMRRSTGSSIAIESQRRNQMVVGPRRTRSDRLLAPVDAGQEKEAQRPTERPNDWI